MTAINLITIIFSAISVLTRFVGECSIRLGRVVTHALSGTVAQCMTLMEIYNQYKTRISIRNVYSEDGIVSKSTSTVPL